jgi:SAM-dependent methyltransferase
MRLEFSDLWSEWLLHRRHGGDPELKRRVNADIAKYADRVLDGAGLKPGMTLADIGTGDGLVALRAIERVGGSIKVVMTDISGSMLEYTEALAVRRGIRGQCEFIQGSADKLAGIGDRTVDAVTTRAVLAYVADKPAALREFHRILRPGGRLSIGEPIMRDEAFEVCALKKLVEVQPIGSDPFFSMLLRWRSAQFPDTEEKARSLPITNYGERDLVRYAVDAGFVDLHLEFHIDVLDHGTLAWDAVLQGSPHPLAPSLGHILETRFTPEERSFFEARLRVLYQKDRRFGIERTAWMTARKPPDPGITQ